MAKSDARLLALTLALRQARAVISKHERLLDGMATMLPNEDAKSLTDLRAASAIMQTEALAVLRQIDEALK